MEQLQVYFTILNKEIDKSDRQVILNGVLNYICWQESSNLADNAEITMEVEKTLEAVIPPATYNSAKELPWLVRNWLQIH